jgi:cytochrome c oxidase assembly factor CtaG
MGDWTFDPLQLAPLALVVVAYAVRARTLARRGTPVPRARYALFAAGVLMLLVAIVSPVAHLSEERFALHMVQHLLLGDLAPLALLAGLTGPLLRPVLALPPVRALRVLAHPVIALPLWVANLYVWHLPFAYEAAIENDLVHAVEHLSFFAAGALMWMPVLETLPAPAWFGSGAKLGYIVAVRLSSTLLANVFLWSGTVFYDPYVEVGLSDQAAAGAIMLVEGSLVTFAAFAWLFLRLFSEGERRQELLERGVDPRSVERAVRYGRADDLS